MLHKLIALVNNQSKRKKSTMKKENNMQKFKCAYTKNDGKTGTLKVDASSIAEAGKKVENFVAAMYKKHNMAFDATSITSMHIILSVKSGRPKKK